MIKHISFGFKNLHIDGRVKYFLKKIVMRMENYSWTQINLNQSKDS